MELILWHKDAKPSSYYATQDGKRIPTARKEGTSWTGTVVGLGFSFGGRRRGDVKELAQRHGERIFGSGEWTLFPARDLNPGMVVGRDTWKDGDQEFVSVEVGSLLQQARLSPCPRAVPPFMTPCTPTLSIDSSATASRRSKERTARCLSKVSTPTGGMRSASTSPIPSRPNPTSRKSPWPSRHYERPPVLIGSPCSGDLREGSATDGPSPLGHHETQTGAGESTR